MRKSSKKSKTTYLRAILFLKVPIIYHREKNLNKAMTYSWEKCQTDRWANELKNRQTTMIL